VEAKLPLCTGLQSRKDVLCALSPGVTGRAKLELCFYIRRRLEPAPSGELAAILFVLPNLQFGSGEDKQL
jgi:hypothetical protein